MRGCLTASQWGKFCFAIAFLLSFCVIVAVVRAAETPGLPAFAEVVPGTALQFPADHGAHPQFRNEWWYITGWLDTRDGRKLGFQVTFFRSRPEIDQDNPSAFAAKEILFAHAALSDPEIGHLLHDQRAARSGFGLAEASTADADIVLDGWRLRRDADGRFRTNAGGEEFALDLAFTPAQPVLLHGEEGYSRKGPQTEQASYYYSLPHLSVSGSIRLHGDTLEVVGTAWLDREWSSRLLDPRAVGWDWAGVNFDDGSALMAFRIRDARGDNVWAGGTFRHPDGTIERFAPNDVAFTVRRRWISPRTGAEYPVEIVIGLAQAAGERQWHLAPFFDDQELDSRSIGGPVYWEGAIATEGGRGYLELTGYLYPLTL